MEGRAASKVVASSYQCCTSSSVSLLILATIAPDFRYNRAVFIASTTLSSSLSLDYFLLVSSSEEVDLYLLVLEIASLPHHQSTRDGSGSALHALIAS
jgi:hypothetical protein